MDYVDPFYVFIGLEYAQEINDAIGKGATIKLTITKILTTGTAGTGKTCTKHYLFNRKPPERHNSTPAFEISDRHYVQQTEDELDEEVDADDNEIDVYRGYVKGCLLYTSPSPRDATLSRMPSSA